MNASIRCLVPNEEKRPRINRGRLLVELLTGIGRSLLRHECRQLAYAELLL